MKKILLGMLALVALTASVDAGTRVYVNRTGPRVSAVVRSPRVNATVRTRHTHHRHVTKVH